MICQTVVIPTHHPAQLKSMFVMFAFVDRCASCNQWQIVKLIAVIQLSRNMMDGRIRKVLLGHSHSSGKLINNKFELVLRAYPKVQ